MVDLPGRSAFEPDDRAEPSEGTGADGEDSGWGSPVPAEYGSLHALSPPERNRDPSPLTTGLFSAWSRVAPRKPADGERDVPEEPVPPAGWAGDGVRPPAERQEPKPDPTGPAEQVAPAAEQTRPAAGPEVGDMPTAAIPVATPAAALPGPAGADPLGAPAPEPAATPPMPTLPPRPVPPGRPGRRPGRSRSRVAVRHVDVASVAKLSVLYYLIVLVVIVVAALLLWVAADVFGTLPSIEKSVRTLFSLRKFRLHAGAVALYTAAAGVVLAVVGTLANILLALIYNLMADVLGGVRVELESFSRE